MRYYFNMAFPDVSVYIRTMGFQMHYRQLLPLIWLTVMSIEQLPIKDLILPQPMTRNKLHDTKTACDLLESTHNKGRFEIYLCRLYLFSYARFQTRDAKANNFICI